MPCISAVSPRVPSTVLPGQVHIMLNKNMLTNIFLVATLLEACTESDHLPPHSH